MEYASYKNSSRTAVSTAEFDEKNFNAVSDISEIATQQLRNFDQAYKTQNEISEDYKKFREEIVGEVEAQVQTEVDLDIEEFMPSLKEKEEVAEVVAQKVNFSLSLKGKLLIAVCSSIMLLLSILLIYNAALIGSYSSQIALSEQTVVEMENISYSLQEQLYTVENTCTPESIGMSRTSSASGTTSAIQKQEKIKYLEETNWFDAICEFISGIFGG